MVQDCLAFFTDLEDFQQLLALDTVSLGGLTLERGIDSGVPGRKLEQIVAMGESALQLNAGEEWLEWCSGKGFLGRILASQSGQKVTSFEFQQSLCDAGQTEADKQGLAMHFIQGDAFSLRQSSYFTLSSMPSHCMRVVIYTPHCLNTRLSSNCLH
ncbi:SAM-dependent methyltransferases [Vibrio ponticus]|nr:SAM-dependent methyltransferases [Vibrio ponticus]